MDMKTKAVYQTAQTKIEDALKDVHDPVVELSLITTVLVTLCIKWSGGSWDKAMEIMERVIEICRHSIAAGKKVFGDKALKHVPGPKA